MRILIAEDDEDSRVFLFRSLKAKGYDVISAEDGKVALELAHKHNPDLIISDIMMPNMDGFELCHKLKTDSDLKSIPFVFYTSTYLDQENRDLGYSLGAVKYLEKPMALPELLKHITDILQEHKNGNLPVIDSTLKSEDELHEMYDHTLSKKLEKKLKELEKQKELVQRQSKNAKIGYWTISVDTNEIIWSNEILKIYGMTKQPEINNVFTLKQNIHPSDYERLVLSLEKAKTDQNYKHDITYRIVRNDDIIWVHCQGKLNPESNMLEGTLQDITELKNTQYELERNKELVISQSKAATMGEMISIIAHQWKQPLSILSMLGANIRVDAELDSISNESIIGTADEIDKQVNHLSTTIDTFRNFLKPNQGKIDTTIESVIDSSIEILNKSLINNNVELEKEFTDTSNININASELMQVIINLINNSKDAFKINNIDTRKLFIRTYEKDNKVMIEIEDTAGGIPTDKIDHVFEAYFTTKSESGGTGLGLYIVKTIIVEHFNGNIEVENTENGVKFCIQLPLN